MFLKGFFSLPERTNYKARLMRTENPFFIAWVLTPSKAFFNGEGNGSSH